MNVLVTGAAGFIGSHLVSRLLADGYEVVALDRFKNGTKLPLLQPKNRQNLRLVKADITDQKETKQAYFENIDWIFHLAGRNHDQSLDKTPLEYHSINVKGTVNILEKARQAEVKKFIYAASASCYGAAEIYPTPETSPPKLENPHALTKYLGELYTLHWGRVYKLPVLSLRLFSVYGPKARKEGTFGPLLTLFIKQKLEGKPYMVRGDGAQGRDLVFVSDVVEAFIQTAKSKITNEVFNVGSGETYTVNKIVELLGGEVVYVPKQKKEIPITRGDIAKIKKMLGWRPKVFLEEGIKKILDTLDCL